MQLASVGSVQNRGFRMVAGVRRDGSNWKLYAALVEESTLLTENYLREEVEASGGETWSHEASNVSTKSFEETCNPKRKGGTHRTKWGHAFYIVEETVRPHWGTRYGAGQRNLTTDADVDCVVQAFGNPGYYRTDSEPTNNDLKTSYQTETYGQSQNYGWKSSENWLLNSGHDRSDPQNPYYADGYWVTNPDTNLTVRDQACVPYSKRGLPWRFEDMVDSLKFLETSSPLVPGTVPCGDVTTSDEVGLKRNSPTSVTVKLSAPTGGFLAQNSPFFQLPNGCFYASMADVTGNYDDFSATMTAYDASSSIQKPNPCDYYYYQPMCQDSPNGASCWGKDDYAVTTISTADNRVEQNDEGDWVFVDCQAGTSLQCSEDYYSGAGKRLFYGTDRPSKVSGAKPITNMSQWTDDIQSTCDQDKIYSQSGSVIGAWPLEYTTIGFDHSTDADPALPSQCQGRGHKTANWQTTNSLAGEYQLNLVPTQGHGCIDFRYADSNQGFNDVPRPGNAPTSFKGTFDVVGIGRLTLTAEFSQYCREEQSGSFWQLGGFQYNKGPFTGAYDTRCPNLGDDFTSKDGAICTVVGSDPTNASTHSSPSTDPDFALQTIRKPWKVTAKVEYTEFDNWVGPRPMNKRHWSFSLDSPLRTYTVNEGWTHEYYAGHESHASDFGVTLPTTVCTPFNIENYDGTLIGNGTISGDSTSTDKDCDGISKSCLTIQDVYVAPDTIHTIGKINGGGSSQPDSTTYDLSPDVRVKDGDLQGLLAGGQWDMNVVSTSLGEFCDTTFKSTFDGYLSQLKMSSNPIGCSKGSVNRGTLAHAPCNQQSSPPFSTRIADWWRFVSYDFSHWVHHEYKQADHHLYPITSFASDPFYAYKTGLWSTFGGTMTGSGIPMVTRTNYGFIDQIYDVEIIVAGGS